MMYKFTFVKRIPAIALMLLGLLSLNAYGAANPIPPAPDVAAKAYFMIDYHTGKVLASKNADLKLPPASLTKMMTAYVALQALKNGQLSVEETITISRKAAGQIGSMMAIRVGDKVNTEQLIKGVVIMSGNDASVALAELVAGSEASFTELMNQTAKRLGMKDTYFVNASGLPAAKSAEEDVKLHYSTARDLSILAKATIRDFPDYYAWFKEKEYSYTSPGHKPYTRQNRNTLLFEDPSVDGLKTGHTSAAGYCLVASASRQGMRLITVVLGTKDKSARAETTAQLLRYGFRFYETRTLIKANKKVANVRIWYGADESMPVATKNSIFATFPRGRLSDIKSQVKLFGETEAPISKGQIVGNLNITLDNKLVASTPVVTTKSMETGSWFGQLGDWLEQSF